MEVDRAPRIIFFIQIELVLPVKSVLLKLFKPQAKRFDVAGLQMMNKGLVVNVDSKQFSLGGNDRTAHI